MYIESLFNRIQSDYQINQIINNFSNYGIIEDSSLIPHFGVNHDRTDSLVTVLYDDQKVKIKNDINWVTVI